MIGKPREPGAGTEESTTESDKAVEPHEPLELRTFKDEALKLGQLNSAFEGKALGRLNSTFDDEARRLGGDFKTIQSAYGGGDFKTMMADAAERQRSLHQEAAKAAVASLIRPPMVNAVVPSKLTVELSKASEAAADRRAGLADDMVNALMAEVDAFEKTLAADDEIGIAHATFGGKTIRLTLIDFRPPHLVIFEGVGDDETPVRLVQHTSQISVLLSKVKAEGREAHRVEFRELN